MKGRATSARPLAAPLFLVLATAALLAPPPNTAAGQEPEALPEFRIGVLRDGPWELVERLEAGIRREIATLFDGEILATYPPAAQRDAGWEFSALRRHFEELLADDTLDLVLTVGPAGSALAVQFDQPLPRPVLAPVFVDFRESDAPGPDSSGSGVANLSYIAISDGLENDLAAFRELTQFDHLALLINEDVLEAIPGAYELTEEIATTANYRLDLVASGGTAAETLAALPEGVDAIYLFPLRLSESELGRLFEAFRSKKIATFSGQGPDHVFLGALATVTPSSFFDRLARRTALSIQRIALAEVPESIPVSFRRSEQLLLNVETLQAIDASPRWEVLVEAERFDPQNPDIDRLQLGQAVLAAVQTNLTLAAERLTVASGRLEIDQARANLRPRVSTSLTGLAIDSESAAASFGTQPQRTLSGELVVSQLLVSDAARGNVVIERALQRGREATFEQLRLDIALDTATAFFNLLRAQNQLRVQQENLRLTRANLELAEVRNEIGVSSAGETLRWRSQIARDRQGLVEAESSVRASRIVLNRLLHVPLETIFELDEAEFEDPEEASRTRQLEGYIETPRHFAVFRDFAVRRALDAAPELLQIEASIAAQERALKIAKRSFWLPEVSAQASLGDTLSESGAGAELAPDTGSSWSAALVGSLDLFAGGARRAVVTQAQLELDQLSTVLEATAERIEESVRIALIQARASSTSIDLARAAAAAAAANLTLVQDAYARGSVSILELLDAQNASLVAERGYTDAVYDFFIDLMQVQRVSNQFDFFIDETARSDWYADLTQHFEDAQLERWTNE